MGLSLNFLTHTIQSTILQSNSNMDTKILDILLTHFSSLCLAGAALLISTIFLIKTTKIIHSKISKIKLPLPPGEMGLPWIGETIDFYKAQRNNRLFEEFVQPRMAKNGKIFKTKLMGAPTIVVNGAEANRFFLSNEFKLVVSSWPTSSVTLMGKNSIMERQGDQHRRLRGIIFSSLAYAVLERLVPEMCDSVQLHLRRNWHGQQRINLYRSTKLLTFTLVFECLLGIKVESAMLDTFERVLEGVFAAPISFPGTKFYRAKKARGEIERVLVKVVRERRQEIEMGREEEGSTLLSKLVGELIRGEISEVEVIDNMILLVFAAHDTTSFAITMTFKVMAQHPDTYARVLQEHAEIMKQKRGGDQNLTLEDINKMRYTWNVAREAMRLFPPIFGSFRKAIKDIQYQGFSIPKGWKVLWTTYGTHYDEEYFKDARSFNPSRFEEAIPQYSYLPFGGGPRLCAGNQLAKLNILIFIHHAITLYDWSLVYPDEQITMDPLPYPSHGMPINLSPRLFVDDQQ